MLIQKTMKNFQIRLADEVYDTVKEIAESRHTSIADVIRESLEAYAIGCLYAQEGRRLVWEDPQTGEKAEVIVPGFSLRNLRQRSNSVSA